MVAKEYQCVRFPSRPELPLMSPQCATCPDPANCARLLEDKWKQAYHAIFRFGWLLYLFLHAFSILNRPSTTIHGISLPSNVGGREPTAITNTFELSNDGQSVRSYPSVKPLRSSYYTDTPFQFLIECFRWEFAEVGLTLLHWLPVFPLLQLLEP
jgi:hypothetical protein